MSEYKYTTQQVNRLLESSLEDFMKLQAAEDTNKALKSRIAELGELIETLVVEGCVIEERLLMHGGSERDLYGWENAIDKYHAIIGKECDN